MGRKRDDSTDKMADLEPLTSVENKGETSGSVASEEPG
jgi:hypothetical protein